MTSYCRNGIALQSISHDCPLRRWYWQCPHVVICNMHLIWLSGGFSRYLISADAKSQTCTDSRGNSVQEVQIYWELELRRDSVIQSLARKARNVLSPNSNLHLQIHCLSEITLLAHCMSRSSFMAFAKEIWRNCFMNTLTPINNFIYSVMTLCTCSHFCIKIIILTYLYCSKRINHHAL